ncbi:MAG TPA: GGDEF domain-containing protein [Caulobacteraceae bacterium]|jgi:diguanylate cyclase
MPGETELALRGPKAYEVAHAALERMRSANVWPTALNFELWVHLVADPDGPLAREIERLLQTGEPISDFLAEELAHAYLPKIKLQDKIKDAGDVLTNELATVSKAIRSAQRTNASFGQQLAAARHELTDDRPQAEVKTLIRGLTQATDLVQTENMVLQQKLADSNAEVGRLRDHLAQAKRDATTDALTSLANRKAFDEELERVCHAADLSGEPVQLAVLDIDHFKTFNDTWGHQTGDQVLRYVASVIGRLGAPPRFAARYGGEEFAMIFVNEDSLDVDAVLREICQEIASRRLKRRSTAEELGAVTISAGFAQRRPTEPPASLMDRADTALYESKRTGRNRVSRAEWKATAA